MRSRKNRIFVGDFETTVFKGQVSTEVWAAACVELGAEDVKIFHSIADQFAYFKHLQCNIICYYHNLKFDGNFWLSYLLVDLEFKQAYVQHSESFDSIEFLAPKDMPTNSVTYSISNMGQWYRIYIKTGKYIIELRDSLKLLPFTVKKIGESFGTKHKKLDMEYSGVRYAGCAISEEEKQYITNDVLVVKEALEIMFSENHKKLTIGSCCLSEYKNIIGHKTYNLYYPNVYDYEIDDRRHGYANAGEWIRQAYHGGWCYLVKGKENRIFRGGTTADVNSLYPSMMSSESNNRYPVGSPIFWSGNYIPDAALRPTNFYFIRIRTRFYLKKGKLPFIQIKSSLLYKSTEMLVTSDVYDRHDGCYHSYYKDSQGIIRPAIVTLTLTMMDYALLQEHYDLVDFEIIDGCYFSAAIGIFDQYIEKYKKIKLENKGAKRVLAKLFLNNLYGKMASSKNSSFKIAYVKDDKSLGFITINAYDKEPGYIPVGAAITSYARNFTIRAAQANYHGIDERGFIYADTDSIHCDLSPDEMVGIKEDSKNFCCWKLESYWDQALFVRQKTYIEHITHEDKEEVEVYYNVKCAGMPEKCKKLLIQSIEGGNAHDESDLNEQEKIFVKEKRDITDFKIGLRVPGKLMPKRIRGGVLLVDVPYEIR